MIPVVSVIVPVYKVEPYLRRCVDSILNQSFSDFELILVDDGSPDNCGAICDEYAAKDSRVHVIHQENGGLSAARNAGIDWVFEHGDSRWIAFIDSDDWVHRDYLKLLFTAAVDLKAGVAMGGYHWISNYCEDADLSDAKPKVMNAEQAITEYYAICTPAWGKIIRKDLIADLRFPVGKLYEDAFVTHKFIFAAKQVAIYEEKLCYYYNNPNSITRTKWSDRKLDSIEAHELRLQYFMQHGYRKAYDREREIYVEELTDKILHVINSQTQKDEHQKTLNMLREKLRTALKDARKDGLVRWNGETMWSYFFALHTDAVWKAARIAQKIYHKIRK